MNTQQKVQQFHEIFRAPCPTELTMLSVSQRLLRIKLIYEEFLEFVEACGFEIEINSLDPSDPANYQPDDEPNPGLYYNGEVDALMQIEFGHVEGSQQNQIEMADALGDLGVVTYGAAICMGIDLDAVISEIHDSNMSKLDDGDQPITNGEGLAAEGGPQYRPDLPIGKIIKGPRYRKPDIAKVLGL